MRKRKEFFRKQYSSLTKEGKKAKSFVDRICNVISSVAHRKFYAVIDKYADDYEAHIRDSGLIGIDAFCDDNNINGFECGNEVGLVFFGGHFSLRKHKDAMSKAWVSLLEDCMGISAVKDFHNLTQSLEAFGPKINFNCKTIEELEIKLTLYGC